MRDDTAMEYESRVKRPDSNSGLFLQEVVPTLGFHASRFMTCSRAGARTSFPRLTGDHFSNLLPVLSLSLSFSHSAESRLVTSCQSGVPSFGRFLSPLASRLTSHLRPSCRSCYSYFRADSLPLFYLYPFSSSNLAPVSSFPTLHLAPFCHRRSLFSFAERDSAAAALPELVHRGKMLREGRSNRRIATLISLSAHIPDSNDFYSVDEVSLLADRIERRMIKISEARRPPFLAHL